MARQPLTLNGINFNSQKDAINFFKEMLSRYRNGQTVTGEDHDVLMALLERHPEAERKIGIGVKRLYKDKTDMPTSCFWIERVDGSKTDFSYRSAISAKGKSLYQEFLEACRVAVQDDLRLVKRSFFEQYGDQDGKVECDVTGERVALYESHLDHKKPLTFEVLVRTFIGANSLEPSKDMLVISQDGQVQTQFSDLGLQQKFREYHHRMAQLRIIKADRNLSLGGSERILKSRHPVIIPKDLLENCQP